ncbi:MAG: hypothetical protein AAB840_01845, partial [Patescibacteria group bacterium]
SPWGFGAYVQGVAPGKMSPQIGIAHVLVFISSCFIILYTLKEKRSLTHKVIMFAILMSLLFFFLALPQSKFIWDIFFPLKLVQLPWRFVGYIVFGASLSAGFLIYSIRSEKIKMISIVFLLGLLIYANRNHVRVNQYIDFENPFDEVPVYGPSTTSKDEHTPKYAPRIFQAPNPHGDIFPPDRGESQRIVWKSNYHLFDVFAENDIAFRDNTSYFPGWIAKIDGKETTIHYETDGYWRLRVEVPAGKHMVEFFFRETWYRLLADIASLVTLLALVLPPLIKRMLKIYRILIQKRYALFF